MMIVGKQLKQLCVGLMALLVCCVYGFADDIKITTSPNPVFSGKKIRFTLISELAIDEAEILIPKGARIVLKPIDKGLFSTTYIVPINVSAGIYTATAYLKTRDKQVFKLPVDYKVVTQRSAGSGSFKLEYRGGKKKQEAGLSNLNIKIDELENALDKMAKNRDDLNKQIKELEEQISDIKDNKKEKDELKNKQELLDALQKELQQQKSDFQAKQKDFTEKLNRLVEAEESIKLKQVALSHYEEKLKSEKEKIDQSSKRLEKSKSDLISQRESLGEEKKVLKKKSVDLGEKEVYLMTLEDEIADKNNILVDLSSNLSKRELVIQGDREELAKEEGFLVKREETLVENETTLLDEKQSLAILTRNIEHKQRQYKSMSEAEQKALSKLRKNLIMRQASLVSKEARQEHIAQSIEDEKFLFKEKKRILSQKESNITRAKTEIAQMEDDLIKKYDSMRVLKSWIEEKNQEVLRTYERSKAEQYASEETFVDQFSKMESLARLLQTRSEKLRDLNGKLMLQNTTLRNEIEAIAPKDYSFSLIPYLGTHMFNEQRGIDTGFEAGLRCLVQLPRHWAFEGFIGIVPTQKSIGDKLQTLSVTTTGILSNYTWLSEESWESVLKFGIIGDFEDSSSFGAEFGLGLHFDGGDDMLTRLEILMGVEMLASIGFEKRIDMTDIFNTKLQDNKLELTDDSSIQCLLTVPKVHRQYKFASTIDFIDLKTHWARRDAAILSTLGIDKGLLSPTPNEGPMTHALFEPKKVVTKKNATRLLVLASHLPRIVQETRTKIDYTIIDILGLSYNTDIVIKNELGQVIKIIKSSVKEFSGDHTAYWSGNTDLGLPAKAGNYRIHLTLSTDGRIVLAKTMPLRVEYVDHIAMPALYNPVHQFVDVEPKDRDLLNESAKLGLFAFDKVEDVYKRSLYQPDRLLTRLDVILAISNILSDLGYRSRALPDMSPYKDINEMTEKMKRRVGLYISALGYGGDHLHRLRPYDHISKAELSVIYCRLLKWMSEQDEFQFPSQLLDIINMKSQR